MTLSPSDAVDGAGCRYFRYCRFDAPANSSSTEVFNFTAMASRVSTVML